MKKHITHVVAIAVLGMVTFFAIPNRVHAAPVFKGQFTLTNDVVWNGTELPAGKYDFTLDSTAMPAKILLHGPNGYMWVLTSAVSGKERGENSNYDRRAPQRLALHQRVVPCGSRESISLSRAEAERKGDRAGAGYGRTHRDRDNGK